VIQSVRPGSPAEDAGLAPGAVILGVDRHPVEDADSFVNQIHSEPAGKTFCFWSGRTAARATWWCTRTRIPKTANNVRRVILRPQRQKSVVGGSRAVSELT
jgi:C-terminal processing protease CtpA/Prc